MIPDRILRICAVWAGLILIILLPLTWRHPVERAAAFMTWGLGLLWVAVGGYLSFAFADSVRGWIKKGKLDRKAVFLIAAVLLGFTEEGIATLMSNLAPLFGAAKGAVALTPSTNFVQVILHHSLVLLVPMFLAWIYLMSRWDFEPKEVMILFGLTGTLIEAILGGVMAIFGLGFWVWVYGLMVYLPAYAAYEPRGARPAYKEYLIAVFVPILFALPVVFLAGR